MKKSSIVALPFIPAQNFTFHDKDGNEMLRLEGSSGNIYVRGKLTESDKEVVEGMRQLLTNSKL